jgi:hypothetical protein
MLVPMENAGNLHRGGRALCARVRLHKIDVLHTQSARRRHNLDFRKDPEKVEHYKTPYLIT